MLRLLLLCLRRQPSPRAVLRLLLLLLSGAPLDRVTAAPTATDARPNLVLVLADDLGYGELGCYGQEIIRTPHLDRMAAEGIRFTQAYSGTTVCAPSRAVLMTGRHAGHVSVRGNVQPGMSQSTQSLSPTEPTVARTLKAAGYATAVIGKWGLGELGEAAAGLPHAHGFDYAFGYLNQYHAHNSYPDHLWRNGQRVPIDNPQAVRFATGAGVAAERRQFASDLFLDEACQFIARSADRPFFLYLALTAPHANNEATPLGLEVPTLGDYAQAPWPEAQRAHAALVSRLDHDVGRLLDFLRTRGLTERTLVLFTSDNGPHQEGGANPAFFRASGPFRGIKRSLTEGGIRVPTIAWWPGRIPAGRVSDALWYFADLHPTLAHLAGVSPPAGLDGIDATAALLGHPFPAGQARDLVWEYYEAGYKAAIRRGDWKLLVERLHAPPELYHLPSDPGETRNLAAREPERVATLLTALSRARTDSVAWPVTSAPYPQSGPNPVGPRLIAP